MGYDFSLPPKGRPTYTVAQLNAEIREVLERAYGGIAVEAEVVELSRAMSGHVYFTLGDKVGSAQLKAVMWKGPAMRYGSCLQTGRVVRCEGRLTLYEARGNFQMVVDRVVEAGAGEKARRLAELKATLAAEGLFDPGRKRPIPSCPACVGVVTSRQGAAFRDIVKVVSRRCPVRIVLAHAQVQGDTAPDDIAAALDRIAVVGDIEVVIVGRGGGSQEDLDAFNTEVVVRKIVEHPVPVISAVGHEIDITLADLAADVRAATPSEAAELAVPDARALAERVAQDTDAMIHAVTRRLRSARATLDGWDGRLRATDPRMRLRRGGERLVRAREILSRWPTVSLQRLRSELGALDRSLRYWPAPAMRDARHRLSGNTSTLEALSPLGALSRGYAVVRTRGVRRDIVRSHLQTPPGTSVDVTLADGRLRCTVDRSDPGDIES